MIRKAIYMRFGKADIIEDLRYTRNHLWVKIQNGLCTLGWTDYIQQNAGDVNFIELSQKGTAVKVDQDFGTIETSKWVDKLCSPINGRVVEVNEEVINRPELINEAPFADGWFVEVEPLGEIRAQDSMSATEYFEYIKTCEGT
jgi:glycine cleavage system H protein